MSRAVFVSDIHISSAEDPKVSLFLRFLDSCVQHKVDQLFLVGDIFDLWIADRRFFVKEYSAIVGKIRQLKHMGIKISYFEGNHDLDLRRFWQHEVGVDVYSEATFFTINGLTLRVEHGDQMDPDDRGYLFLRWLLRTKVLVGLGRYLPGILIRRIGRRASATSRDYTTQVKAASDEDVRAKIHRHVERVLLENRFDISISGHVHVAEDTVLESGVRCINLGTWLKRPLVLEMQGTRLEINSVEEWCSNQI